MLSNEKLTRCLFEMHLYCFVNRVFFDILLFLMQFANNLYILLHPANRACQEGSQSYVYLTKVGLLFDTDFLCMFFLGRDQGLE